MAETKIKESQVSDLSHSVEIQKDDAQEVAAATVINFEGNATVTDEGGGKATITVSGSGGGGATTFLDLTDAPDSYSGQAGLVPAVNVGEDGLEFVAVSGSGAGSPNFTWWNPYAPPASPSSYDDEFNGEEGAGAPTGWTEYDVSSVLTVSEEERGLQFLKTSTTQDICGVYKDVPVGWDHTVYTKIDIAQYQSGDTQAGIFFSEDIAGNPTTCDHEFFGIFIGGAGYGVRRAYFTDYNSLDSEAGQIHAPPIGNSFFLRVRCIVEPIADSNYKFGYSTDGRSWFDVYSTTRVFAPAEFGLFVRTNQTSTNQIIHFPFFRVDTSTGNPDSTLPADRVGGYLA